MKNLMAAIAVIATSMIVTPVIAGTHGAISDGYYGHMYSNGMGFLGFGMMILVWGGLILLSVFAVRWLTDRNGHNNQRDALEILRERFARGDIDPEEYEARRKVLES